jgi:Flp pilus assembly protein TadG
MTKLIQKSSLLIESLRRNQAGGALAEAALTAPLLVFMILGVVEFGRAAYIAIETSNAARAAVAYGSQNQITAVDTSGMQAVARLEAAGLTAQSVNLTVNTAANCSCSSPDTSTTPFACAGASTALCPSPSFVEQTLNVTVTATFNPIIHAGNFPGSFTITGRAVQKRLN